MQNYIISPQQIENIKLFFNDKNSDNFNITDYKFSFIKQSVIAIDKVKIQLTRIDNIIKDYILIVSSDANTEYMREWKSHVGAIVIKDIKTNNLENYYIISLSNNAIVLLRLITKGELTYIKEHNIQYILYNKNKYAIIKYINNSIVYNISSFNNEITEEQLLNQFSCKVIVSDQKEGEEVGVEDIVGEEEIQSKSLFEE